MRVIDWVDGTRDTGGSCLAGVASSSSAAMNLHHLELFYYVARHGGISRAVRHMPYGIQQPAVSGQILTLEQDLATKLFERQPFKLTRDGEELYAFLRPFFDNVESVCRRMRNRSAPTLRIAASELILRDYLPTIIQRMREHRADLRFALRSGYQSQMERWLEDRQIDFAITTLDARPSSGLQCLSIVKLPLVLLAPKSSRWRSAEELWRQKAVTEPLIRLPLHEGVTRAFDRGLGKRGIDW